MNDPLSGGTLGTECRPNQLEIDYLFEFEFEFEFALASGALEFEELFAAGAAVAVIAVV